VDRRIGSAVDGVLSRKDQARRGMSAGFVSRRRRWAALEPRPARNVSIAAVAAYAGKGPRSVVGMSPSWRVEEQNGVDQRFCNRGEIGLTSLTAKVLRATTRWSTVPYI
jgi:hypothetical protein